MRVCGRCKKRCRTVLYIRATTLISAQIILKMGISRLQTSSPELPNHFQMISGAQTPNSKAKTLPTPSSPLLLQQPRPIHHNPSTTIHHRYLSHKPHSPPHLLRQPQPIRRHPITFLPMNRTRRHAHPIPRHHRRQIFGGQRMVTKTDEEPD